MAHTCHAIGCKATVPPEMFMCRKHWYSLPHKIRTRIWSTYRPGQCEDWQPSAEYCAVAKEALLIVAEREGREIDPGCPEIGLYDLLSPQEITPPSARKGEA